MNDYKAIFYGVTDPRHEVHPGAVDRGQIALGEGNVDVLSNLSPAALPARRHYYMGAEHNRRLQKRWIVSVFCSRGRQSCCEE